MATAPIPRDPITTHILDSTTGLPAPSIPVTLTLLSPAPAPAPAPKTNSPSSTTTNTVPITFTARTSSDGRITHWTPHPSLQAAHSSSASPSPSQSSLQTHPSLPEIFSQLQEHNEDSDSRRTVWSLKFETVDYWGGEDKTFYPEVEVRFFVDARGEEGQGGRGKEKEKHWHVPVLLGPWGYTTYRGS